MDETWLDKPDSCGWWWRNDRGFEDIVLVCSTHPARVEYYYVNDWKLTNFADYKWLKVPLPVNQFPATTSAATQIANE